MSKTDSYPEVYAKDQAAFRDFLSKNHGQLDGIWLIYYKKDSTQPSVSWVEAVEEALCFGWIDSKVKTIDEQRYKQIFTKRKKGSMWSAVNKAHLKRIYAAGKMTPAGQQIIDAAKADGSWTFLDSVENLELPADLLAALTATADALDNFNAFPDSVKKSSLLLVKTARRDDTRTKRIAKIASLAAKNQRAV